MAMKKIYTFIASPILIAALVCFLIAGISWKFTQDKQESVKSATRPSQKTSAVSHAITDSTTISPVMKERKAQTSGITPLPTPTSIPIPTNTPSPQPTATPTPTNTITLQINEPDGNISFSLEFHSASTPCSILNDAKNEGKIRSATITHYGPPLNSDYVKEINGYSDNWTFAINGTKKPLGCSNYQLSSGNTVAWTYQ